jgi:CRISPR-associated helicase Cas3
MRIKPYSLPLLECPEASSLSNGSGVDLALYPHQAVILDEWEKHNTFLLVTKTGTGKTIASVLPLLLNALHDGQAARALAVYPTNALVGDQIRSIADVARRLGLRPCVLTPETRGDISRSDVVLVHVDADSLDGWVRALNARSKSDALRYLLEADTRCKIVLTNPDSLFLILAMRFNPEAMAALQAYKTLIVDEFHLYQGVELAHALFMIHFARSLGAFRRTLLLSATPHPETLDTLRELLDPLLVDTSSSSSRRVVGERRAVHSITLKTEPVGPDDDIVKKMLDRIADLRERLLELRGQNPQKDYVPAVLVVNSVMDAIRIERRLVERGLIDEKELAVIRGLTSRKVRPDAAVGMTGKLLAVGTSAIEVGIDFQCDFLLFEAGDASSFLQRFGRLGRHRDGTAFLFCPYRVHQDVVGSLDAEVDRGRIENLVYQWYPSLEARPWFAKTRYGFVTVRAFAESIVTRVRNDWKATVEQSQLAEQFADGVLKDYAAKLDSEAANNWARLRFRWAAEGHHGWEWLADYVRINSFRTSMPSVLVHDWAEFRRRGSDYNLARYSVDVATLLRRSEGLRFNPRLKSRDQSGMFEIRGYSRFKRVYLKHSFSEDELGCLLRVADYPDLIFFQDGRETVVSSVMHLGTHIFTALPANVRDELDWRLPIFPCGNHVVAFDGAALLCLAIWEQSASGTC